MRRAALLTVLAAACTRPVLYYPSPEAAGVTTATAATPATPTPPLLVLGSTDAVTDGDYLASRGILVPVAGADMTRVEDSFNELRDGDRTHEAIDILAPRDAQPAAPVESREGIDQAVLM